MTDPNAASDVTARDASAPQREFRELDHRWREQELILPIRRKLAVEKQWWLRTAARREREALGCFYLIDNNDQVIRKNIDLQALAVELEVIKPCVVCGRRFGPSGSGFCSERCKRARHTRQDPAVYRFVCPDGRSYVGSVSDCGKRTANGVARSNPRLDAAFAQHPPETWTFEVLERLPPACPKPELREAEQRHIDRLRTWDPAHGFNMYPAVSEKRRAVSARGTAEIPHAKRAS